MDSLGDGFVSPRENVAGRLTPQRGRFTAPRENDSGMFRECSLRDKTFSPRGKLTPLNDCNTPIYTLTVLLHV